MKVKIIVLVWLCAIIWPMTENRRIFLNIIATYGRSLFMIACGLFTSRWVLMALGEVDYGLYGVIGGLGSFFIVFNALFSAGIGRFYAVSVGEAKKNPIKGIERCRAWFNTALVIHTMIPLILMSIGYPLGEYAIRNAWLNIPPDRVDASLWVFRFTCMHCMMGMVNVPFQAMYIAKQYIAELTIYNFVTTILNVCFLYYIASHPGEWLTVYAFGVMFLLVVPQIIIAIRACIIFPECQFRYADLWDLNRIKQVLYYSGWLGFGNLGTLIRGQGVAILINRAFGPTVNAAMTIGNNVSTQMATLSAAIQGAFSPAIMTAYGAGDLARMRALAYRACKFGALLLLVFLLPLAVELPYVLELWLKEPPRYTQELCWCILAMTLLDKMSTGYVIAVTAKGTVAAYQAFWGTALIVTPFLAWIFVKFGWGVVSVGLTMVITMLICVWGRVWFARRLVGMSALYWVFRIFLPLFLAIVIAGSLGFLVQLFFDASFLRLCLSTAVTELNFFALAWILVLDKEERGFVLEKTLAFVRRFKH